MTTLRFISDKDVADALPHVVDHLRGGGLIAYPTETVYGFGSLVQDDALADLAALKSRDEDKPFLLLIRDADDIAELQWTPSARKLAAAFWPGALTLALRVHGDFPSRVLSDDGTVAIRATPHAGVRALLRALSEPLTSTSANAPRKPPATSAQEVADVLDEIGAADVCILDGGQLPASSSSTLVDCSREPPRVLRPGAITIDALTHVVELAND